jgi:hypothetical protein
MVAGKQVYAAISVQPNAQRVTKLFPPFSEVASLPRVKDLSVQTRLDCIPVHPLVAVDTFEGVDTCPGAEWLQLV